MKETPLNESKKLREEKLQFLAQLQKEETSWSQIMQNVNAPTRMIAVLKGESQEGLERIWLELLYAFLETQK